MSGIILWWRRLSQAGFHPGLWFGFALACLAVVAVHWWQYKVYADRLQVYGQLVKRQGEAISKIQEKLKWSSSDSIAWNACLAYQSRMNRGYYFYTPPSGASIAERLLLRAAGYIRVVFRPYRPTQPPTRVEVEKILNDGQPLRTIAKGVRKVGVGFQVVEKTCEEVHYLDCQRNLTIAFYFDQGRIVSFYALPTLDHPPTEPVGLMLSGECHRFLIKFDCYVWLALIPVALVLRRHRMLSAELLIMLALVTIFVRSPSLPSKPSIRDYLNVAHLPWGLAMICAGLTILAWAYFVHQLRIRILCPVCDYNLSRNAAGICPECGTPVSEEIRRRLAVSRGLVSHPGAEHTGEGAMVL